MAPHFSAETIHLRNLRVDCIIGMRPRERVQPQALLVTLAIPRDFGPASSSEALRDTLDYGALASATREFLVAGRFQLLETLARSLGAHLTQRFGLRELHLTVHKPQAVNGSDGPAVSLTVRQDLPSEMPESQQ